MTVQTISPHEDRRHRVSTRSVVLGIAGVGLAVGVGLGVDSLLADEGRVTAPGQQAPPTTTTTEGAHDSWEGRLQPAPAPGTDHDGRDRSPGSGLTDQQLERLR